MEFFTVMLVAEAQQIFLDAIPAGPRSIGDPVENGPFGTEEIPCARAGGRVLAQRVIAAADLPGFDRSTVDGFVVRAADTFGATESFPAYLKVDGEVLMGQAPARELKPGQAFRIATGAMLPPGADAVVMVEHTEMLGDGEVACLRPAAPGDNVIARGEDARARAILLEPGRVLRPQEIGALALAGLTSVRVARRPRVAIISTGDELVPPGQTPGPGQISDTNSSALAAAVELAGGEALPLGVFPDRAEVLEPALQQALEADMVLISGGSSVGTRDLTARLIAGLGKPGILVHGVSVKPGKPTILAVIGTSALAGNGTVGGSSEHPESGLPDASVEPPQVGTGSKPMPKPVIGLPGHPVSALVIFDLFGRPAIRKLLGLPPFPEWEFSIKARLSRNIASAPGRLDCLRVSLRREGGEIWADPVLGKSGLLTTLVQADGLAWIEPGREGLLAGEIIDVRPFQGGDL